MRILEVVEKFRREGFYVTAQILRNYEAKGLFVPEKCSNGFRDYSGGLLSDIRFALTLRMLGYSIKETKKQLDFYDLKDEVSDRLRKLFKSLELFYKKEVKK